MIRITVSGINQEMITNFQSKGSFDVCYVKSVDSINYLITINLEDELKVYEIINKDSLEFMHSENFENLYENKNAIFRNKFMFFDIPGYFVIYNFVEGKKIKEKIPEDYFIINYKYVSDSSLYFSMKDNFTYNSHSKYFKYSFESGISECDELIFRSSYKKRNFYIFESMPYQEDEAYYLYDEETDNKDTLLSGVPFPTFIKMYMGEEGVWYQDTSGVLCFFNYITKEKKKYSEIKSDLRYFNIVKENGNSLIILNSGKNGVMIQFFDLITKKRTHQISSDYSYTIDDFKIIGDKLIAPHYEKELVVIDVNTGSYKLFDSYNVYFQFLNLEDIDKRYIFNISSGYFNLIDLKNMTTKRLVGHKDVYLRYKCDYVKLSEKEYFVSLTNYQHNIGFAPLFYIDLSSNRYKGVSELLKTYRGLDINSRLISVNGEVVLITDDFYHIGGTTVEKINNKPIVRSNYRFNNGIFKKDLYYFTHCNDSDSLCLMKYDGRQKSLVATLLFDEEISSFNEIVIIDNTMYLIINNRYFYKYSLNNHNLKKISNHILSFPLDEYKSKYLFNFGKDIYYCDNLQWELYAIYNNGEPQYVTDNLVRTTPVVKVKNKIFIVRLNGIYELKNHILIPLLEYDKTQCELHVSVIPDKEMKYILIPTFPNLKTAYFYNGEKLKKIIPGQKIFVFNELGKDVYRFWNNYLFDCNKEKVIHGLDLPYGELIFDALIFQDDTILVTFSNKTFSEEIHFYHSTNSFLNNDLKASFHNISDIRFRDFLSFGKSGLFYLSNKIFYIDEKKEIHLIKDLLGIKNNRNIIAYNEYSYFIAIDKINGKQVFRIKMHPKTNSFEEVENNSDFGVFPNPTADYIMFENDFKGKNYKIFNINGTTIKHDLISVDKIDISGFEPGVYIIVIGNGLNKYCSKFLKI